MTKGTPIFELAFSMDVPVGADAPDWIPLLPATDEFMTHDGRGPYRVENMAELIAASFADPRNADGLVLDENHATDNVVKGTLAEAPARGWIREMRVRDGALEGRVDWTEAGRKLVADRAYRSISPVLMVNTSDRRSIIAIPRASLVNFPNLRGMPTLHMETSAMEFMKKIAGLVGLDADASEDEITSAVSTRVAIPAAQAEMQSSLDQIGVIFGVEPANVTGILTAAHTAKANAAVAAELQSQLATVTTERDVLAATSKRALAEAYVDGERARMRSGLQKDADREFYITLHMSQPDTARRVIEGMICLTATHTNGKPPGTAEAQASAVDPHLIAGARALGKSPQDLATLLAADRKTKETI